MNTRIAIASDDEKTVASHLGRTKGFVICDVEDGKIRNREYRLNTFTGHVRGSEHAGCGTNKHEPVLAALADCKTVVSHGMGRRIYDDLRQVGIDVIITGESDIEEVIRLYLNGVLIDRPELGCDHGHQ
jgi:predicted Fe-Mo cluster-binding NifX family protein